MTTLWGTYGASLLLCKMRNSNGEILDPMAVDRLWPHEPTAWGPPWSGAGKGLGWECLG